MNAVESLSKSYAFFDVDDTLISVKSMLSFQPYWYKKVGDDTGRHAYEQDLKAHLRPDARWEFLNRLYYRHFAGRSPCQVAEVARQWFDHQRSVLPNFYHEYPLRELRAHQRAGREVVFVSGSFPLLLQPIAEELGVRHILATNLEVCDGLFTGNLLPPQTIGRGKAQAIHQFLLEHGAVAETCYAYGDDVSDLPMLQAVGMPTVVSGGRELEAKARAMGWRVIAPA